jgi:hypothetical protein
VPTEPAAASSTSEAATASRRTAYYALPRVPLRAQKDVLDPKLISPTMEGHE